MTARVDHAWVLRRRLATQRLTGVPMPRAVDTVRLLTCVQSQDAPLAHLSLGLRTRTPTYAAGLAEQATGAFTRTHILRPTWHFVAAEDLRWIQALTGPKVLSGLAGRHRGLGLDGSAFTRAQAVLEELLAGGRALTRSALTTEFAARGLPAHGEQMAHQLMQAEITALICGGPPAGEAGSEHTYVLAGEAIPPSPDDDLPGRDQEEAVRHLVLRFMAGHGPADDRDLTRWSTLTLGQVRPALADLESAGQLTRVELDGAPLWYDPSAPARTSRCPGALLLSTFDEATLTYARTGFPQSAKHLDRTRLVSQSGGGTVVIDGMDVGLWTRAIRGGRVEVRIRPEAALGAAEVEMLEDATARLGRFLERDASLTIDPVAA